MREDKEKSTCACGNYGFKGRNIFAELAAAVASLSDSVLPAWEVVCKGFGRWEAVALCCLAVAFILLVPQLQSSLTPQQRQMAEGVTEGSHTFLAADSKAC